MGRRESEVAASGPCCRRRPVAGRLSTQQQGLRSAGPPAGRRPASAGAGFGVGSEGGGRGRLSSRCGRAPVRRGLRRRSGWRSSPLSRSWRTPHGRTGDRRLHRLGLPQRRPQPFARPACDGPGRRPQPERTATVDRPLDHAGRRRPRSPGADRRRPPRGRMSVASDGPGAPLVVDGTGMLCVTLLLRLRKESGNGPGGCRGLGTSGNFPCGGAHGLAHGNAEGGPGPSDPGRLAGLRSVRAEVTGAAASSKRSAGEAPIR
jgi:hypothetical protein